MSVTSEEDDSSVVRIVKKKEEVEGALEEDSQYGEEALREASIPTGRELRVRVIEDNDSASSIQVLAIAAYFF